MNDKVILLVEDNPRDEALTERALKKSNIVNKVVVARDGGEALDHLWKQRERNRTSFPSAHPARSEIAEDPWPPSPGANAE